MHLDRSSCLRPAQPINQRCWALAPSSRTPRAWLLTIGRRCRCTSATLKAQRRCERSRRRSPISSPSPMLMLPSSCTTCTPSTCRPSSPWARTSPQHSPCSIITHTSCRAWSRTVTAAQQSASSSTVSAGETTALLGEASSSSAMPTATNEQRSSNQCHCPGERPPSVNHGVWRLPTVSPYSARFHHSCATSSMKTESTPWLPSVLTRQPCAPHRWADSSTPWRLCAD